jgi:hypothetical protein
VRRYTPDFFVRWSMRAPELIEVKYEAEIEAMRERFAPRFAAAQAWAREREASFRTVTEREIRGPLLENARRLLPLRGRPLDLQLADALLCTVRSLREPSFGAVLEALCGERRAALATLWCLIARGTLEVDLTAPIGLSTPVRAP